MASSEREDVRRALRDLADRFPIETLEDPDLAKVLQKYSSKRVESGPFSKHALSSEVIFLIFNHLSLPDMLAFTQICRSMRRFSQPYLAHLVNELIAPYIEPRKLYSLMRETGSVLSGSSVLWLLDGFPESWKPKDLDFYCPAGNRGRVVAFLESEGYKVTYKGNTKVYFDPQLPRGDRQMSSLLTITKLELGEQKIDILESKSASAVEPIQYFHSTVVMNFISADFIVCLYPLTTFEHVGTTQSLSPTEFERMKRYSARGFTIGTQESHRGIFCPKLQRSTGDSHSFVAPYSTEHKQLIGDTEPASWTLDSSTDGHQLCSLHGTEEGPRCVFNERFMEKILSITSDMEKELLERAMQLAKEEIASEAWARWVIAQFRVQSPFHESISL